MQVLAAVEGSSSSHRLRHTVENQTERSQPSSRLGAIMRQSKTILGSILRLYWRPSWRWPRFQQLGLRAHLFHPAGASGRRFQPEQRLRGSNSGPCS